MPQKRQPRPKPPAPTYDYSISEHDVVICFKSSENKCTVKARLLEAAHSEFHDEVLQHATQEINEILDTLERNNRDASRHLSFIDFQNRSMLVWSKPSAGVSREDDEDEIAKALRLTRSSDVSHHARKRRRS